MKAILLVFLFFLSISLAFDCCEVPALKLFCPRCYGKCSIRENPHLALKDYLEERLFGQDHVIKPMVGMVEKWYKQFNSKGQKKLMAFHVAGDNGVGKTYAISLMVKAIFREENPDGFLLISGSNFAGIEPEKVEGYHKTLYEMIVKQLEKCSKSLIVIDEAQYIHVSTLRVLQQFMDNNFDFVQKADGTKVVKSNAMIGIVSDFGQEGRTKDMSFEELEDLVISHTKELWREADPKQAQLLTYNFPFVTLSDSAIEDMIRYIVEEKIPVEEFDPKTIYSINISEPAVRWMRYKVAQTFTDENGRGVAKWIEKRLLPRIKDTLYEEKPHGPAVVDIRYRNNDVEITAHGLLAKLKDEM